MPADAPRLTRPAGPRPGIGYMFKGASIVGTHGQFTPAVAERTEYLRMPVTAW